MKQANVNLKAGLTWRPLASLSVPNAEWCLLLRGQPRPPLGIVRPALHFLVLLLQAWGHEARRHGAEGEGGKKPGRRPAPTERGVQRPPTRPPTGGGSSGRR